MISNNSSDYLSYDVLTTSEHSYFMTFPDLGRLRETDLRPSKNLLEFPRLGIVPYVSGLVLVFIRGGIYSKASTLEEKIACCGL
jgi:hypothetical protein